MRLITNRIFTSKPKVSYSELLKSAQAKNGLNKTASANGETKVADKEWFKENVLNKGEEKKKKTKEGEPEKEETTEASTEVEIKLAEDGKKKEEGVETYDGGKTEAKLVNTPEECKDSNCASEKPEDPAPEAPTTTKTNDGTFPSSGQPQAEAKLVNTPRMPTDKDVHTSSDAKTKEATTEGRFIRVANLTTKQKSFLKDYWRNLYGEDYANAMVADK